MSSRTMKKPHQVVNPIFLRWTENRGALILQALKIAFQNRDDIECIEYLHMEPDRY